MSFTNNTEWLQTLLTVSHEDLERLLVLFGGALDWGVAKLKFSCMFGETSMETTQAAIVELSRLVLVFFDLRCRVPIRWVYFEQPQCSVRADGVAVLDSVQAARSCDHDPLDPKHVPIHSVRAELTHEDTMLEPVLVHAKAQPICIAVLVTVARVLGGNANALIKNEGYFCLASWLLDPLVIDHLQVISLL